MLHLIEPRLPRDQITARTKLAEETLAGFGVGLFAVLIGQFEGDLLRRHHDQVQTRVAAPGDWILWAGVDEFQVYPEPLPELVTQAEREGYNYFRAEMIDRLADGSPPEFVPGRSTWEQFQRRSHVTRDVAGAWDMKTTCGRAAVTLRSGNHAPLDEDVVAAWPRWFEVHYFKWDASVIPRLQRRLQPDWKERCCWWTESAALPDHIERNGDRVQCASPR